MSWISERVNDRYAETDAPVYSSKSRVVQTLFRSRRAEDAMNRDFSEGPIEVRRGDLWLSDNPKFLKAKDWIDQQWDKQIPTMVDDKGRVYGNGVRTNVKGIRHVSGYPMIPATFPLASNTKTREDKGLENEPIDPKHELLYKAFFVILLSDLSPRAVKIRKGSSLCVPTFFTKMYQKRTLWERHLAEARTAGELLAKGDYVNAFDLYGFGGANYVVYREQSTDKVTLTNGRYIAKDRYVADLLYAATSGREGTFKPSNKVLTADDIPGAPKGFFRTRRRTAMGGPGAINAALAPTATAAREGMYEKHPKTFHLSTRENKKEVLGDSAVVIAVDQGDHDILWWPGKKAYFLWAMEHLGFAEWHIAIAETSLRLPAYVSSPGPNMGHVLIGDWRDPACNLGLPSGIVFTDLWGMSASVDYLIPQIDYAAPHYWDKIVDLNSAVDFLTKYYNHELPIAQMNKGDDGLLLFKPGANIAGANQLLADMQEGKRVCPYADVGYEHGGAFLGDILCYDSTRSPINAQFIPNIVSMVVNLLCPEYSVNSRQRDRTLVKRGYPGLSYQSMKDVYPITHAFGDAWDILERGVRNNMGFNLDRFLKEDYRQDKIRLEADLRRLNKNADAVISGGLTRIEQEVLADPSKSAWKFSDKDIRPEIDTLINTRVELDIIEPYFKGIYA